MSPFSFRCVASKIFAETFGWVAFGALAPCALAAGTFDFSRCGADINNTSDVLRAARTLDSTGAFSTKTPTAFSNGYFDGVRGFNDDDFASETFDFNPDETNRSTLRETNGAGFAALNDDAESISVDDFANVDSFAPVGANESTGRSTATLGPNGGFSFAQEEPIVRGSVRLPELKSVQIWGNGYFGSGKIKPLDWDGAKLKNKTSGATVGLTIPLGLLSASGYYNYNNAKLTYDSRKITQKTNLVGLAGYAHAGGFYATLLGSYGADKYSAANRDANLAEKPGYFSSAKFDGSQASGYFETGYEWPTLGLFVLKPFGSYQYSYAKHDAFNGDTFATSAGKDTYDACYMTLGSRVDVNLAGMDSFTIQVRTAWTSQLRSQTESMQSFCFGRIPGTLSPSQPYFVGKGAGSDYFWGGAGLRLSLFGAFSIAGDYDCLLNGRQSLHVGSLALLAGF